MLWWHRTQSKNIEYDINKQNRSKCKKTLNIIYHSQEKSCSFAFKEIIECIFKTLSLYQQPESQLNRLLQDVRLLIFNNFYLTANNFKHVHNVLWTCPPPLPSNTHSYTCRAPSSSLQTPPCSPATSMNISHCQLKTIFQSTPAHPPAHTIFPYITFAVMVPGPGRYICPI